MKKKKEKYTRLKIRIYERTYARGRSAARNEMAEYTMNNTDLIEKYLI